MQPGSQGQVRVWAPRKLVLTVTFGLWWIMASCYFGGVVLFAYKGNWGAAAVHAWICIILSVLGYRHFAPLRRPRYLTTDDAGIALTTDEGSRTLRWPEILRVRLEDETLSLEVRPGTGVKVDLAGFPVEAQKALRDLIRTRCERCDAVAAAPRELGWHSDGRVLAPANPAAMEDLWGGL